jgi:hypothetical protein
MRTVGDILDDLPPIGHNKPPLSPFEVAAAEVAKVRDEAVMWLDGAPVTSQEQADGLALMLDMARKAEKLADSNRKAEAEPFDRGKAEVQARYKPLIEDVARVTGTIKAALATWLMEVDARKRAEAEAARVEAERRHAAAIEARANLDGTNLAAQEAADAAANAAQAAEKRAAAMAKDKAHAKSATGARAIGLRTIRRAVIVDETAFARHIWKTPALHEQLVEAMQQIAQREVARGNVLPGVKVVEEKVAA